jgi:hypothetical protein
MHSILSFQRSCQETISKARSGLDQAYPRVNSGSEQALVQLNLGLERMIDLIKLYRKLYHKLDHSLVCLNNSLEEHNLVLPSSDNHSSVSNSVLRSSDNHRWVFPRSVNNLAHRWVLRSVNNLAHQWVLRSVVISLEARNSLAETNSVSVVQINSQA